MFSGPFSVDKTNSVNQTPVDLCNKQGVEFRNASRSASGIKTAAHSMKKCL